MARIGGNTYAIEAARVMTAGAVDLGEKPSVISAIVKYHCTERGRQVVNDAMDVHGGKGICLGPNNYLGQGYQQVPIGITVEGANILTRSMIIFGQGAIRCHPYVLKELAATREADPAAASRAFDAALWGHVGFLVEQQGARALARPDRRAAAVGAGAGRAARAHLRRLTRLSAALCGRRRLRHALPRRRPQAPREDLGAPGRCAEPALPRLVRAQALSRRGCASPPTAPFAQWALDDCMHRAQEAFFGLFENFPVRWAGRALRLRYVPARPQLCAAQRPARSSRGQADAGGVADARAPDRRHLPAQARGRSDGPPRGCAGAGRRGRRGRGESARCREVRRARRPHRRGAGCSRPWMPASSLRRKRRYGGASTKCAGPASWWTISRTTSDAMPPRDAT